MSLSSVLCRSSLLCAVLGAMLVTGSAHAAPLNVTGRWKLGDDLLLLQQHGNHIIGSYRNGQSSMEGTLHGRTWKGTFRYNSSVHGSIEYTFSLDGMHFKGPWANLTDSKKGIDTGDRLLDITGKWKVDSYILILKQNGNQISGTYRDGRSSMKGTLAGRVWKGTFKYNSSVHGTIEYTFSPDFTSFKGPWANTTDSNRGVDIGTRIE